MKRSFGIFGLLGVLMSFASAQEPSRPEAQNASVTYSEVSRKAVVLTDHTVTLIRVRPPALPKIPVQPAPPPASVEERATAERYARKSHAMLNVSVNVYLGGKTPVSEIRWRSESGEAEYSVWSNVDFRYLAQVPSIETGTTVYSWFPFIDECDLKDWPADQKFPIPTGISFSPTEAEYFIKSDTKELKEQEVTLAGLDYIHAYYQINYAYLKAAFEKREAENAERERQLRENPPKKPDTVIHFWPEKSQINR